MNIIARLDEARAATNVLQHPFYRRWSAGELSRDELARYAGEYRHAVIALADASQAAARAADPRHSAGLLDHAAEERAHVGLWDAFATACGASPEVSARPGTIACVSSWTAGQDLLERLAVLYAIEAGQPEISATKLQGLRDHYPYVQEGPATEYFSLHQTRDVEHARAAGELIGELLEGVTDRTEQGTRMVSRAQDALAGNWRLLDDLQAV